MLIFTIKSQVDANIFLDRILNVDFHHKIASRYKYISTTGCHLIVNIGENSAQHPLTRWYHIEYYSVTKILGLIFFRKPGGFQRSALARGDLKRSYACVIFFPAVNSIS